jgi:2-polyprenyl-6-hydroxyphenyl methylase/3-demethylubiquinone-9 3-methyltransferase
MTSSIPSADPREIEHFTKFAETWWDPTGPFWPLHKLNALRVDWIVSQLKTTHANASTEAPLKGLKVLDVGCGGGILSESLARLGADVTGIDVVEKNIAIAKAHAAQQNLNIQYQLNSVEALSEGEQQFDVVFNMEVVEHVADLPGFMQACNALVKQEGSCFVATINRNWLAWFVTVFGAEYVLQWLPKGTHHYRLLRTPNEIKRLLDHDGLHLKASAGVRVNPIKRSMALCRSLRINYMLHAVKSAC